MKIEYAILALCLYPVGAMAQTEKTDGGIVDDEFAVSNAEPQKGEDEAIAEPNESSLKLNLPEITSDGHVLPMYGSWRSVLPYYGVAGNYGLWNVHEGLNTSIGMSVFSTFGSGHTWSGAGFSENIALMYAIPINNKLSFAVGGYFQNTTWAHDSYRNAGLTASLGYRFDDHWSAYVYGQKSLIESKPLPPYLMDVTDMGDRIGAAVRYDFNKNFSVQLNVEASSNKAPDMPVIPNANNTSPRSTGIRR